MFGSQLGWFSLGGRDNQIPAMGIYEQLMNDSYIAEIDYLRLLAQSKMRINHDFLQHGRALRDVDVTINGTAQQPRQTTIPQPHAQKYRRAGSPVKDFVYRAVMVQAWLSAKGDAVGIFITTVERGASALVGTQLDLTRYGFPTATATSKFEVYEMSATAPDKLLTSFVGISFAFNMTMAPRAVSLLKIALAS